MIKINLSFAKIVATPSTNSWSQAYNAGNFFVVLSLTNSETQEDAELTNLGKTIINNLEAEFFGLETKSLSTIKEAVLASLAEVPQSVSLSLSLAYLKDQILYVLLYGAGNVLLKRDDHTGNLLHRTDAVNDIVSASGYIKQGDIIILRTKQFADLIPIGELNSALELTLPNDIAETLTPHVHNAGEGGAAAIFISITGVPALLNPDPAILTESSVDEEPQMTPYPLHSSPKKSFKFPSLSQLGKNLPLKRVRGNKKSLILLIVAGVIITLLFGSVFMTMQQRKENELQKKFIDIQTEANEKYQEAEDIQSLNPKLSADILRDANTYIEKSLSDFPQNSTQRKSLVALQQKIKTYISKPLEGKLLKAENVDAKEAPLLQEYISTKDAISVTEDDDSLYVLTNNSISSVTKTDSKKEELIKNETDWKNAVSLGTYLGNLYVLDKSTGVIKFVVAEGGYGKTDYFTTAKPDLSKTVSIAIDGSIWLLANDGALTKYTKGVRDAFEIKGLDELKNPIQIFTTPEINNLYILDPGTSRIIQLQKDGLVKTSFRSDVLSNAKAITLSSDEKTIYVLSDNKIWKLTP